MVKYCPACGSEAPEDASFCMDCGTSIESGEPPQETDAGEPASEGPPAGPTTDTQEPEGSTEGSGRKITVGWVAGYLVGAVVVLLGLVSLFLSVAGGVVLLLVGLFAMPYPRAKVSSRAGVSFSRVLVVVVVTLGFVTGMVFVGLSVPPEEGMNTDTGDGGVQSAGPDTATPTTEPTTEAPLVHAPGETFTVGSGEKQIQYTVTRVTIRQTVGDGFTQEDADGQFVVIDLAMTNTGSESLQLSSSVFRLVDDQGREYETDSDAVFAIENNVIYEQLDPGVQKDGTIVFDVPPDQSGRRLQIRPAGVFSGADAHYVEL